MPAFRTLWQATGVASLSPSVRPPSSLLPPPPPPSTAPGPVAAGAATLPASSEVPSYINGVRIWGSLASDVPVTVEESGLRHTLQHQPPSASEVQESDIRSTLPNSQPPRSRLLQQLDPTGDRQDLLELNLTGPTGGMSRWGPQASVDELVELGAAYSGFRPNAANISSSESTSWEDIQAFAVSTYRALKRKQAKLQETASRQADLGSVLGHVEPSAGNKRKAGEVSAAPRAKKAKVPEASGPTVTGQPSAAKEPSLPQAPTTSVAQPARKRKADVVDPQDPPVAKRTRDAKKAVVNPTVPAELSAVAAPTPPKAPLPSTRTTRSRTANKTTGGAESAERKRKAEEDEDSAPAPVQSQPAKRTRRAPPTPATASALPAGTASSSAVASVPTANNPASSVNAVPTATQTTAATSAGPPAVGAAPSTPASAVWQHWQALPTIPYSSTDTKVKAPSTARPFVCVSCGGGFGRKEQATRHHNSKHTNVRQFVCHCGKDFNRRDNLQAHQRAMNH